MDEQEFIPESQQNLDPYDREERCRKALRTIRKAVFMRILAGALLLYGVIRAGANPVALGLTAFALVMILAGVFPLAGELRKQKGILKDCLEEQEALEQSKE